MAEQDWSDKTADSDIFGFDSASDSSSSSDYYKKYAWIKYIRRNTQDTGDPQISFCRTYDCKKSVIQPIIEDVRWEEIPDHLADECDEDEIIDITKVSIFQTFFAKIRNFAVSATGTDKSYPNFLNSALCYCCPEHPTDPFYMFGIDLFCTVSIGSFFATIFEEAKLTPIEFNLIDLDESVTAQLSFIQDLDIWKNDEKKSAYHVVHSCVEGLTQFEARADEMRVSYSSSLPFRELLWLLKKSKQEDLSLLDESELQKFLYCTLRLDDPFCVEYARILKLEQFKLTKPESIGQKCKPDLVYQDTVAIEIVKTEKPRELTIELKSPSRSSINQWIAVSKSKRRRSLNVTQGMKGLRPRKNIPTNVKIKVQLLWQVFEQLFGMAMKTGYDAKDNSIIIQPGILVEHRMFRVIFLVMKGKTYKIIRSSRDAAATLNAIFYYNIKEKGNLWCKLYLVAESFHFCDITRVCKTLFSHYCMFIDI